MVPFSLDHLDGLTVRDEFAGLGNHRERLARLIQNPGAVTYTVTIGGQPGAVVGLAQMWPGVATAWTLTSDKIKERPVEFTRVVRRTLDDTIQKMNLHRVQATVRSGYMQGQRWACMMGFIPECELKHYGPDKSHHTVFRKVIP